MASQSTSPDGNQLTSFGLRLTNRVTLLVFLLLLLSSTTTAWFLLLLLLLLGLHICLIKNRVTPLLNQGQIPNGFGGSFNHGRDDSLGFEM